MSKDMLTVEAAAALLEGAGGVLPITSLNKALFYLDLHWLLHHGQPLTNSTYLALENGPVVAKYHKRLVGALEDAGIAIQDEADDGLTKPVCLTATPDYQALTSEQRDAAQRLGAWAAKRTASSLSTFSHENAAWKLAWDRGLGARHPAEKIDLRIAMQQLVDDDAWLSEPADAELADLFGRADGETGSPW